MAFYGAQTFYIDPSTVGGSSSVYLSKVRLFFRQKPSNTTNKSGIVNPGCTVHVVPTRNGIPDVSGISTAPVARLGYNDILASTDASQPSDFTFDNIVLVGTGVSYAAVVSFDGDEDFVLWTDVQNDDLIGTTTPSTGAHSPSIGSWYDYVSTVPSAPGNSVANSGMAATGVAPTSSTATTWRSLSSTQLKFSIFCARFSVDGNANLVSAVASNTSAPASALVNSSSLSVTWNASTQTYQYLIPSLRYEYFTFDYRRSDFADFRVGERAWQVSSLYPNDKSPAAVSVVQGSNTITSSTVDFSSVFSYSGSPEYVVVVSANNSGDGRSAVAVRKLTVMQSNSSIQVDSPLPFTNSSANFYKAPVGRVEFIGRTSDGKSLTNVLTLSGSNANSTVRFAENRIESVTVSANGTGYSNTDVVTLTGYEDASGKVAGNYPALAVITTNGNGAIVSVQMANGGSGFVNTANVVAAVANSSGGASLGSGATFSYEVGSTIASEYSYDPGTGTGLVANARFFPMSVHEALLNTQVSSPFGTFYNYFVRLPYYKVSDENVAGGYVYHCEKTYDDMDYFHVTPGQNSVPDFSKNRVLLPWSRELVTTYVDGTVSNGAGGPANTSSNTSFLTSNGSVLVINTTSNCDFTAINPGAITATYFHYLINDDLSLEETNYGSALARGLTGKVTFRSNASAEDLRVYIDCWRPANTDVVLYAKVHNDQDPESFDDKDWTLLTIVDGGDSRSSDNDQTDLVQLTYGFDRSPAGVQIDGLVTASVDSATLTGVGTSFTTDLAVGDLVVAQNPLFPTDVQVSTVTAIANDASLTLADPIGSSVGGGSINLIRATHPHQAFNNPVNDNITRYYSETMAAFDAFNTMQVKVVLVSDDDGVAPRVDSIQAVGVSS